MSYTAMNYTKMSLANGDVLTAAHMATIDKGLTDAATELAQLVAGKQDNLEMLTVSEVRAMIAAAKPASEQTEPDPEPDP